MHGAFGGAPRGSRNGRFRTGAFTAEMIAATRHVRGLERIAGDFERK
jgi:hypothetical protein